MTTNIEEYLRLHNQIVELQKEKGAGTPEEEEILCEMDVVWYRLSPQEMTELNNTKQTLI